MDETYFCVAVRDKFRDQELPTTYAVVFGDEFSTAATYARDEFRKEHDIPTNKHVYVDNMYETNDPGEASQWLDEFLEQRDALKKNLSS